MTAARAERRSPSEISTRWRTSPASATSTAVDRFAIQRLSLITATRSGSQPGLERSSAATCGATSGTQTSAGASGKRASAPARS